MVSEESGIGEATLREEGYPRAVVDEVMEVEAQDPVLEQGRAA